MGDILSNAIPDPVPPELAPFLASARTRLAADTEGLQPHEVIAHLESAVARAEIEAAQLGLRFEGGQPDAETMTVGDGTGSVVVIRRFVDPDDG